MSTCLLGLGSNLGDRQAMLEAAVDHLANHASLQVRRVSDWLTTEPIGGPVGQSAFLNGAVLLDTTLDPPTMLRTVQQIETDLGRQRNAAWAARPIDLDLLLYDDCVLSTDTLTLPHRWLPVRRFALEPSCQIAPDMVHAVLQWSVARMLQHLDATPPRFVVIGASPATAQSVAEAIFTSAPEVPPNCLPTDAPTSSVPAVPAQIEWLEFAGCEKVLACRLQAGLAEAEVPRAIFFVELPEVKATLPSVIAQLVAADCCPFVVVKAADVVDQVREIVGGVLAAGR